MDCRAASGTALATGADHGPHGPVAASHEWAPPAPTQGGPVLVEAGRPTAAEVRAGDLDTERGVVAAPANTRRIPHLPGVGPLKLLRSAIAPRITLRFRETD